MATGLAASKDTQPAIDDAPTRAADDEVVAVADSVCTAEREREPVKSCDGRHVTRQPLKKIKVVKVRSAARQF